MLLKKYITASSDLYYNIATKSGTMPVTNVKNNLRQFTMKQQGYLLEQQNYAVHRIY